MERVYLRMPFAVAKTILERAGYIKRDEGRSMLWFERTGYMSNEQRDAINDLLDGLCTD